MCVYMCIFEVLLLIASIHCARKMWSRDAYSWKFVEAVLTASS